MRQGFHRTGPHSWRVRSEALSSSPTHTLPTSLIVGSSLGKGTERRGRTQEVTEFGNVLSLEKPDSLWFSPEHNFDSPAGRAVVQSPKPPETMTSNYLPSFLRLQDLGTRAKVAAPPGERDR